MARPLPLAPLALAALVVSSLAVTHAPVRSAETTRYRLPEHVRPYGQSVLLLLDPDQTGYSGSVRIDLEVLEATNSFALHAEEMELKSVVLEGPEGKRELRAQPGDLAQVDLVSETTIPKGRYALHIEFANDFGTRAVGLYRMEQDDKGFAFTQFEADDAREAFPCWDEPNHKIPWDMTIRVPEEMTAVTNTPVAEETVENGWRTIRYARSKPLPTYLIAIAAGRLESVPFEGMSTTGRIVTTPGGTEQAGLALEMTPKILVALEEYFGEPYPYEKLDFIAIPDYWPGAMEHPGAVTYADGILLLDPATASARQKSRLARIIAHELAHMWFGDVVTMEWWDDLWLNESFADWMGDKIASQVYPELNIELTELNNSVQVMSQDARPSAQAIQQEVTTTDNLLQNVGVQYNKGKAVLAMIEQWIGPEAFRDGVREYIEENRWGNARSTDLWRAFDKVTGEDVSASLATFIEQPGVPLIEVRIADGNRVLLAQQRFANAGVVYADKLLWKVPVTLRVSDGERTETRMVYLEEETRSIEVDLPGKVAWVLPNVDQRGYYRWRVPDAMLLALSDHAAEELSVRERLGFVGNLAALLDAGAIGGDDYLRVLQSFAHDENGAVVEATIDQLERVERAFITPNLETPFAAYVRASLRPVIERIGIEPEDGEPGGYTIVRPIAVRWLGTRGYDSEVMAWGQETAEAFLEDPDAVDGSLGSAALRIAAFHGDEPLFSRYCERSETVTSPAARRTLLQALGAFRNEEVLAQALQYSIDGPLRAGEFFRIPFSALDYPANGDVIWEWFTSNYETITERIPPIYIGLLPRLATGCSEEVIERAETFFAEPDHSVSGTQSELAKVSDAIRDCAGLREREGTNVAGFLQQQVGAR